MKPSYQQNKIQILPFFLLCLLYFLIPFFPDEKIYRYKLFLFESGIVTVLFIQIILFVIKNRFFIRISPLNFPVTLYFICITLLYILSPDKAISSMEFNRMLLCICIYFTISNVITAEKHTKIFLIVWIVACGLISVYGILQKTGGVGIILVPKMDRVMATFGNPIFFSAFLIVSFPLIFGLSFEVKNVVFKIILFGIFVIVLIAIYYTKTRAAWIASFFVIFFGILFKIKNKLLKIILSLLFIFSVGTFSYIKRDIWLRDQAHLLIWRDTLKMWAHFPIFGTGPGTFHIYFPDFESLDIKTKWPNVSFIVNGAHNEYLQILSETGLLGFGIFLLIVITFSKTVCAGYKQNKNLSLSLFLSALGLGLQNIFSIDMRFLISSGFLFTVIALVNNFYPLREISFGRFFFPLRILFIIGVFWMYLFSQKYIFMPLKAQKIIEATPDFFQTTNEIQKKIVELEKLAKMNINQPNVYEKLGYYYAKGQNLIKAKENFEIALKLNPNLDAVYNNLGNVYFHLGNKEAAIEYYKKSIAINPNQLDAHINLGIAYYYSGKIKESATEFNTVLKIDPKNEKAIIMLRKMFE